MAFMVLLLITPLAAWGLKMSLFIPAIWLECFSFDEGKTFAAFQLEGCLPIKVIADAAGPRLCRRGVLSQVPKRRPSGRAFHVGCALARSSGPDLKGLWTRKATVRCFPAWLLGTQVFHCQEVTAMPYRHSPETFLCFHNNEGFFSDSSLEDSTAPSFENKYN